MPIKYRTESDKTTKWYDYDTQMWANAASVTEEYRNVEVGSIIPEEAVLAYFVWIPRYEYMYTNLGNNYAGGSQTEPGEIKINFIGKNITTASSSDYKIHPAFHFGGTEVSGIWVGKFETTGEGGTPTIKPNLSSLRNQNVSTQFGTAPKFSSSTNSYGISNTVDAHMMKNSEWGAIAYLSQSKYGKYGNSSYTGANKEVYINNNSEYITGCSGGTPNASFSSACVYTYEKNIEGTGASTTGTIYGVYDMSGGAIEYVMGVYSLAISGSGFSSWPEAKYYNEYQTEDAATACNNTICYGHALSETSGWYSDNASFVDAKNPWFVRGGSYVDTTIVGVFCSSKNSGNASSSYSFRVVLSAQ